MRDRCNCGKPATGEYLVKNKGVAWTIRLCDDCKPRVNNKYLQLIS